MRLYLVQHGEACRKDVDPARPLTKGGRKDVERLAGLLEDMGVVVTRVVHSGKLRAEQTAARLAKTVAPGVAPEVSAHIAPDADPAGFDWRGEGDALVVGHLPFMGRLVSLLVAGDAERPTVAYEPGTAVCLERDDGGRWRIAWMVRPEILRR